MSAEAFLDTNIFVYDVDATTPRAKRTIAAAAAEAKCSILYSEDLGRGMKINGVRIENLFRIH